MKIKFTANEDFAKFNGPVSFTDGQIKEVAEEQAAYLIKTWPGNFTEVGPKKMFEGGPFDNTGDNKRLAPEGKNRLAPTGKNRKA